MVAALIIVSSGLTATNQYYHISRTIENIVGTLIILPATIGCILSNITLAYEDKIVYNK